MLSQRSVFPCSDTIWFSCRHSQVLEKYVTEQEVTCRKMGNKGGGREGEGTWKRQENEKQECEKSTGRRENAPAQNSALVWESVSEFYFKM